jgi:hypothetical protein
VSNDLEKDLLDAHERIVMFHRERPWFLLPSSKRELSELEQTFRDLALQAGEQDIELINLKHSSSDRISELEAKVEGMRVALMETEKLIPRDADGLTSLGENERLVPIGVIPESAANDNANPPTEPQAA